MRNFAILSQIWKLNIYAFFVLNFWAKKGLVLIYTLFATLRRPSHPRPTSKWLMDGWSSPWPFFSAKFPSTPPKKSCPKKEKPQRVRILHLKWSSFFYQGAKSTLECYIKTMMQSWNQNGGYSNVTPPNHACIWNSGCLWNFVASCPRSSCPLCLFFLPSATGHLVSTSSTHGLTWKRCACNEVTDNDVASYLCVNPPGPPIPLPLLLCGRKN